LSTRKLSVRGVLQHTKLSLIAARCRVIIRLMQGRKVRTRRFWLAMARVCALLSVPHLLIAAVSKTSSHTQTEQSGFAIEAARPVERPAELPTEALDALSRDGGVDSCLENDGISAKELPPDWFLASEIHLGGPNELDFVVLPSVLASDVHRGNDAVCFLGASTAQMWVLHKSSDRFQVLGTQGQGLTVLSTRTNGLRDIRVGASVGGYYDTIDYRFDGKSYQIAARKSELVGAEIPKDLSGYERRKALIQLPGQTAESIRAQARAWIWQEWWERRSYLKIKTRDDEADETTSYYITPDRDTKGQWQIIIKTHRVLRPTATQGAIKEDKLSIVTDIRRIETTSEDSHRPRVIPDTEVIPESKYRLEFLDYGERIIGTL
jgi:hypothetical protein